ncbi:MAG: DUF4334 domain-containing protein [Synechococcaceae cyanobacterium]|nr:DUF4334 domain-containing protein [Synechococcaceae cyanobacterium]
MTTPLPAPGSTAAALALFDRLEPLHSAALRGRWRGESCPSGHPLDGALEAYGWYGKRFDGEEAVHPLLFRAAGGRLLAVDPGWLGIGLELLRQGRVPRAPWLAGLFRLLLPLLATGRSRARLRDLACRGKVSATMLYDQLPIHDVFRRVDADTLLGMMDLKGMEQPFFFLLRRDVQAG